MPGIADRIREEQRATLLAMTPQARLEYALAAGRQALDAFASAQGVDRATARQRLRDLAQRGRAASRCMSARGR